MRKYRTSAFALVCVRASYYGSYRLQIAERGAMSCEQGAMSLEQGALSGEQGAVNFERGMKILNTNPNQNALDCLALGSRFRRIASLEILTEILIKILNTIR